MPKVGIPHTVIIYCPLDSYWSRTALDLTAFIIGHLRLVSHYARDISKRSSVFLAFQTLNWTLFKPEEFENSGFLFSSGRETFWKRSFFENDGVTMIKSFFCQSFPQTQNQNGRCVLRFQIPPGKCEWGLKCRAIHWILHKETQTDKKWAKFWSYEGLNKKGF